MRTLFQLISKYHFALLFLLFELVALGILVRYNSIQRTSFLSSSNAVFGSIYNAKHEVGQYFGLTEENRKLQENNEALLNQSRYAMTKVFGDRVMVNDTLYSQQYVFISAEVVNITTNKQKNFITIDKGTMNGIDVGMGVMSDQGIVGIVNSVSGNFATVLPCIHIDSKISAKLGKNDFFGSLVWDGKDAAFGQLIDMPSYAFPKVNDNVVTSGFSAIFPKGLHVGKVTEVVKPDGENFYELKIEMGTSFGSLSKVYVIKNFRKDEQKELEKALEDDGND